MRSFFEIGILDVVLVLDGLAVVQDSIYRLVRYDWASKLLSKCVEKLIRTDRKTM